MLGEVSGEIPIIISGGIARDIFGVTAGIPRAFLSHE